MNLLTEKKKKKKKKWRGKEGGWEKGHGLHRRWCHRSVHCRKPGQTAVVCILRIRPITISSRDSLAFDPNDERDPGGGVYSSQLNLLAGAAGNTLVYRFAGQDFPELF